MAVTLKCGSKTKAGRLAIETTCFFFEVLRSRAILLRRRLHERESLAVCTLDVEANALALVLFRNGSTGILGRLYLLALDLRDQVARTKAGLGGGGVGLHIRNHRAFTVVRA